MMKNTLSALVFTLFMMACNNDNSESIDFAVKNDQEINDYISANNLDAKKSNSGLYYVVNEAGTDEQPTVNSNVTVAYKGYFTNGSVFDQSSAEGISFNLQQVIKGWAEGITYFKEGGSGLLMIPAHLGYGSKTINGIPGGSVLIFDIHLIAVN